MARWVKHAGRQTKALAAPVGDGFPQGRDAQGGRVDRKLVEVSAQRLGDKLRRTVLGLTNRQGNRAFASGYLHAA